MIDQLCIIIFGSLAIALISHKSKRVQYWGFVCGILSEPAWIHTAYKADQWAVVLLAIWWLSFYVAGAIRRYK